MADHLYEWHLEWDECPFAVRASDGERMEIDEIERRLNATEKLRGSDAAWIAETGILNSGDIEALQAYAAALEGKNA